MNSYLIYTLFMTSHLYLVVLGGRITGCNVELHDVRWVVGETIEDTIKTLKREWFGDKKGLHIDSYRKIQTVDGMSVNIIYSPKVETSRDEYGLWFVNLGGYSSASMAEQHEFGIVVARTAQSAKIQAKQRWLKGLTQIHKDDLDRINGDPLIDDLLPIQGNGRWHIELTPSTKKNSASEAPDWTGYWLI